MGMGHESGKSDTGTETQKTRETRNRLALGALLLLLSVVIYSQFFSGGDAPKSRGAASATTRPTPSPTPPRQTSGTPEPIISQPLDLASIQE